MQSINCANGKKKKKKKILQLNLRCFIRKEIVFILTVPLHPYVAFYSHAFSLPPLVQRLKGFTNAIFHVFKQTDSRAFWCKCKPKAPMLLQEMRASIHWCHTDVPTHKAGSLEGILRHTGQLLWLTSFSFSLCLPKFVRYLQWSAMETTSAIRGLASATTTGQW